MKNHRLKRSRKTIQLKIHIQLEKSNQYPVLYRLPLHKDRNRTKRGRRARTQMSNRCNDSNRQKQEMLVQELRRMAIIYEEHSRKPPLGHPVHSQQLESDVRNKRISRWAIVPKIHDNLQLDAKQCFGLLDSAGLLATGLEPVGTEPEFRRCG